MAGRHGNRGRGNLRSDGEHGDSATALGDRGTRGGGRPRKGRRGHAAAGTVRYGRIILIALGVLLAAVVVYAALLLNSVRIVRSELGQAVNTASSSGLAAQLASTSTQGAGQADQIKAIDGLAAQLKQHSAAARAQTDGIIWGSATMLPGIGNDFTAVRTATDAFDTLAGQALPELVNVAGTMQRSGLANADGSFNVRELTAASAAITAANATLQTQMAAVDAAPEPNVPQVRSALATGRSMLATAAGRIDAVSDTVGSLAALFGHDGTRHYLILSQTNAETQAAGGVVGSVGTMTVTGGKVTIGEFHSDSDFATTAPVNAGNGEIDKMYAISRLGVPYGGDIRLASATPNFPIGAEYAKQVWAGQTFGSSDIDGVVSFDTIALQKLIGVTGDITLSGGRTLTATNAAQYLANQVYVDIPDQAAEDAFFEESAQRIIGGSLSGLSATKALKLVDALPTLAKERHLYLWSFHTDDQPRLRDAGMTGEPSNDPANPVVGIYANEMGWTKSDWYVRRDVTAARTATNADGSATYHVTVTTRNTMTAAQAGSLPAYITGTFPVQMIAGLIGQSSAGDDEKAVVQAAVEGLVQPGVIGHSLAIAQPAGGAIANITVNGNSPTQVPAAQSTFDRIESNGVTYWMNLAMLVSPGSSATVEFDVTTAPGAAPLAIDATPAVADADHQNGAGKEGQ